MKKKRIIKKGKNFETKKKSLKEIEKNCNIEKIAKNEKNAKDLNEKQKKYYKIKLKKKRNKKEIMNSN